MLGSSLGCLRFFECFPSSSSKPNAGIISQLDNCFHWNTFRLIHPSFIVLWFCDAVRAVQRSTNRQERVSHSTAPSAPVWRPHAIPPRFRVRWSDVLALSNNSSRARVNGRLAWIPAAPHCDEQFKMSCEHGNEISALKQDGEICDLIT
jgi:hypothetical protein